MSGCGNRGPNLFLLGGAHVRDQGAAYAAGGDRRRRAGGPVKTASVTVSWGLPDETVKALRSLASMTVVPDLIICVDNGSSAQDLSQLRANMPKETVLIEVGENLGFDAANNLGMEYALSHNADWILLLNNDATVERECLSRCLADALATPGVAIVGPAVTFADRPDLLWFGGGKVSDWFAYPRHRGLRQ